MFETSKTLTCNGKRERERKQEKKTANKDLSYEIPDTESRTLILSKIRYARNRKSWSYYYAKTRDKIYTHQTLHRM
jgi:hypothetical protein